TADRVIVFYAGQVVEHGPAADVLRDPQHPYTAALLEAVPGRETDRAEPLAAIPGAVPPPRAMPPGCRFHTRCAMAWDECARATSRSSTPCPGRARPGAFGTAR